MRKEAIYYIPMTKKDSEAPLMMEYMLEVGEEVNTNRSSHGLHTCNNKIANNSSSSSKIEIY